MILKVSIPNWEKYNPREDVKKSSWLRLESQFFMDPDLYGASVVTRLLYVFILCERSRLAKDQFSLNVDFAAQLLTINPRQVIDAIVWLEERERIRTDTNAYERVRTDTIALPSASNRRQDHQIPDTGPTNDTVRDETDGTGRTVDAGLARPRTRKEPTGPTPGSKVWDTYRNAYSKRYGQEPARNAKSNALCAQLVQRLGEENALKVVEFYLTHSDKWYVQKVHMLEYCVKDAEALQTQMAANYRVTASAALKQDSQQSNAQNFQAVAEKLKAEGLM